MLEWYLKRRGEFIEVSRCDDSAIAADTAVKTLHVHDKA